MTFPQHIRQLQRVADVCRANVHTAGVVKHALQRVKDFSSSLHCTRLATPLEKFTPKSLQWVKVALLQAHSGPLGDRSDQVSFTVITFYLEEAS